MRWPLVVAAVALSTAGCGGAGRPDPTPMPRPAPRPPTDQQLIQRLLIERATALGRQDARAFAATSVRADRPGDRRATRRLRGLGVRAASYVVERLHVDGDRAQLYARLRYGVRGLRGSFGAGRALHARRTDAGWKVAGPQGRRSLEPWEAGSFRRVATRHFVVWAAAGTDVRASGLAAALEDGYARMQNVLETGRLRRRYLVVAATGPGQARRLTASIRGLDGLTALTDTQVHLTGPAQRVRSVSTQRLIVVMSAFTSITEDAQRTAVAHELTHAALAPRTSGRTPSWLAEGVAMYVSGDRRAGEAGDLLATPVARAMRQALTLRALARPDAIARLDGGEQGAAYAYASAAAHYVARRFGRRRLLDLHGAFNREDLVGDPGERRLTDAATRAVLGIGAARLERDLRRWLARA